MLLTGVASAFATVLSKFIIYPIESIKTKVQVTRMTKVFEPGLVFKLVSRTYKTEGVKGFYRGVALATIGSAPACALYFMTYEFFKIGLSDVEVCLKLNSSSKPIIALLSFLCRGSWLS